MYYAVITNKGRAWLEEPGDTHLDLALRTLAEARLEASDPEAMERAFAARIKEQLGVQDEAAARTVWEQLTRQALVKVREPWEPGTPVEFVLSDPPVEYFKEARRGGKRAGAGAKPRDPHGRTRIQRSITLGPDAHQAVLTAQSPGETYSETVERLIQTAVHAPVGRR